MDENKLTVREEAAQNLQEKFRKEQVKLAERALEAKAALLREVSRFDEALIKIDEAKTIDQLPKIEKRDGSISIVSGTYTHPGLVWTLQN